MRIGFTGTWQGMTDAQHEVVWRQMKEWTLARVVHHGMCEGADAQFHAMAERLGLRTFGHPGVRQDGTLWRRGTMRCNYEETEAWFLERNKDIVKSVDVLLVTPSGPEKPRSGTWSTVRYARKIRRWHIIVWPDGAVSEHKP